MSSKSKPQPELPMGARFAGHGSIDTLTRSVLTSALKLSMDAGIRKIDLNTFHIDCRQTSHWLRTLRLALPQRASFLLSRSEGKIFAICDFKYSIWYCVLITSLGLMALSLFVPLMTVIYLPGVVFQPDQTATPATVSLFGLLSLLWIYSLLDRGFGHPRYREKFYNQLVEDIAKDGGFLSPESRGGSRRQNLVYSSYLGGAIFLSLLIIAPDLSPETFDDSSAFNVLAFTLLAVGTSFSLVAAIMILRRGAALRMTVLLCGCCSSLSLTIWVTAYFLPFFWNTEEVHLLINDHQSLSQPLELVGISYFFGLLLMLSGSAVLFRGALNYSVLTRDRKARIAENRARASYAVAVEGKNFLFLLQVALIATLGLMALYQILTLAWELSSAFRAAFTPSSHQPLDVTRALMASIFGLPPSTRWVEQATLSFWAVHAAVPLLVLLSSTIQLILTRRRTRLRLNSNEADSSHLIERRALGILNELCMHRNNIPAIKLSVARENWSIAACSYSIGLLRADRIIEVSRGALDPELVDDKALRVILAHEIAHMVSCHCMIDTAIRWLCRLSFAGDGFARGIQDSFGNETRADEIARNDFGIDESDFYTCLERIRHLNGLLPASTNDRPRENEPSSDWKEPWKRFLTQYTSDMRLHYWHPDYQRRTAGSVRGPAVSRQDHEID